MHVFIGGAYNGKHEYVRNWLIEQHENDVAWYEGVLPKEPTNKTIVISHLEKILQSDEEKDELILAKKIAKQLQLWEKEHQVIVIATEMGRGIVPLSRHDRTLRDACGRLYQELFKSSEHVTRIWYGLSETIK
ncbi:bifunctional adenosylcobinamide kinase/adenosylcobinamide-phosphate guanylyltransferase [Rummeliibacillus stabekisii]|uniref:bifunctional adenosylcobinamide kinase/adenosylcobinamide-phosphate guanylyltransferase n=1 Tax=Rummeliibacillus stabekisii TaxID=241244 RepID=UPI0011739AD3|nr:bifunctional adenosylcobinamide kinase/adenosylcobinamide-phosphate guanylyltransferase [Rummeliibacillus stabekisii]MBB5170531.1 adenosyl cobinamide kinase/adenosyl cobinamide phosphate guanylyltransferase [Rummeliibacillus stabekisii]GEL04785.1 hypothetical protein RST01_14120 [Rummeliibacillus stabekisii]